MTSNYSLEALKELLWSLENDSDFKFSGNEQIGLVKGYIAFVESLIKDSKKNTEHLENDVLGYDK